MTASVMFEEQERCLAAGMDDYISKPMTLQAVQSVLAQWGHAETPVS
jgi:CheY-like chemotaxis protein